MLTSIAAARARTQRPWIVSRAIERNRARNLGGRRRIVGGIRNTARIVFSRCRRGTTTALSPLAPSLFSKPRMEIRNDGHMDAASKRRGKGFFSSRIRSSRCFTLSCYAREIRGREKKKKKENSRRKKERERGAATKVGRRVIATFCHLDGDRTSART